METSKTGTINAGSRKNVSMDNIDTVKDFLTEQNIVLNDHDQIDPNLNSAVRKGMDISVQKGFPANPD